MGGANWFKLAQNRDTSGVGLGAVRLVGKQGFSYHIYGIGSERKCVLEFKNQNGDVIRRRKHSK